ncbi:MAG: hypothetical protein ACRC7N_18160 [Clostridium sp.]
MLKVKIISDNKKFFFPIPYFLGNIAINFLRIDGVSKKERILIKKCYKACKKEFKKYKGLTIVDIKSKNGEQVKITL